MTVHLTRRADDWMAQIDANPEKAEAGFTPQVAVANALDKYASGTWERDTVVVVMKTADLRKRRAG